MLQTVNKQQLSDVGLVFSLSPKPPIKDIKHHRKAVHVTGFGGLVFLSNEVHRNDFVSSFSVIALPNHFQLSQSPVSCLSFHSLQ